MHTVVQFGLMVAAPCLKRCRLKEAHGIPVKTRKSKNTYRIIAINKLKDNSKLYNFRREIVERDYQLSLYIKVAIEFGMNRKMVVT